MLSDDDICVCGHGRSEHLATFLDCACQVDDCDCTDFDSFEDGLDEEDEDAA